MVAVGVEEVIEVCHHVWLGNLQLWKDLVIRSLHPLGIGIVGWYCCWSYHVTSNVDFSFIGWLSYFHDSKLQQGAPEK